MVIAFEAFYFFAWKHTQNMEKGQKKADFAYGLRVANRARCVHGFLAFYAKRSGKCQKDRQ